MNNPYRYVDLDVNYPVDTDGIIAIKKEVNEVAARCIQRSKQIVDFAVAIGSEGMLRTGEEKIAT